MKRLACLAVMLLCLTGCAQLVPALAGYGGMKFVEQVIAPAIANAQKAKKAAAQVATTAPATIAPAVEATSLPPEVHEALEVLPDVVQKLDQAYTGYKSGSWEDAVKGLVGAGVTVLLLLARWYYKVQPAPEQEIKLKQAKLDAKTDIALAKVNGKKNGEPTKE